MGEDQTVFLPSPQFTTMAPAQSSGTVMQPWIAGTIGRTVVVRMPGAAIISQFCEHISWKSSCIMWAVGTNNKRCLDPQINGTSRLCGSESTYLCHHWPERKNSWLWAVSLVINTWRIDSDMYLVGVTSCTFFGICPAPLSNLKNHLHRLIFCVKPSVPGNEWR
jgi:hypothetical protein